MTEPIATKTPFSGFSVADVDATQAFYSEVLGLEATKEGPLLGIKLSDSASVLAYPKDNHEPATFTILNFPVDDIDAAVDTLTERGVTFLRYQGMPQDEKGVMRGKSADMGPDIAWFADPSGNVLSILQE